jgi:hypothetical protein
MVLDAYDVARLIPRMEALYTGVVNEKLTTDKAKPVKEAHG